MFTGYEGFGNLVLGIVGPEILHLPPMSMVEGVKSGVFSVADFVSLKTANIVRYHWERRQCIKT